MALGKTTVKQHMRNGKVVTSHKRAVKGSKRKRVRSHMRKTMDGSTLITEHLRMKKK